MTASTRPWFAWSRGTFALTTVALVVFVWLLGQVAGAGRFEDWLRVAARVLQIAIGVFAVYFIFTWASAWDRRDKSGSV